MIDDDRVHLAMPPVTSCVIGWDIGGVNTKIARVVGGELIAAIQHPFELQRAPDALVPLLRELATRLGAGPDDGAVAHAVTMTAELSQMFRTKRDGVNFVLDAIEAAFRSSAILVYTVDGRFLQPREARKTPITVAAANWVATADAIAARHTDAILIDIGTTTTDIIPIVDGRVVAKGRTDPERLASRELVYTGVLRTPTEAIASLVPLGEQMAGVSAEGFALAGDVHVWRGELDPADYTVPAPDGRPAAREFAGERLARVVCADRELLDAAAVSAIADALAAAQVNRVAAAIARVLARHPSIRTAVTTGLGEFLAAAAARAAGLNVVSLAGELGDEAARCAPAAAVALRLYQLHGEAAADHGLSRADRAPSTVDLPLSPVACRRSTEDAWPIDVVVKLGGSLLADVQRFERTLNAIGIAARERRLLVVPGGGPFADTVRAVDRCLRLSDDAAHWMAVLAMDQYAQIVAERLAEGELVMRPGDIRATLARGRVPVLAPSRWIRQADPLPHSWDVTSDSIAAWVAGRLNVPRIALVKPPAASQGGLVDAHFYRALPPSVTPIIVRADDVDGLLSALRG